MLKILVSKIWLWILSVDLLTIVVLELSRIWNAGVGGLNPLVRPVNTLFLGGWEETKKAGAMMPLPFDDADM
jgi:hypothetical protein